MAAAIRVEGPRHSGDIQQFDHRHEADSQNHGIAFERDRLAFAQRRQRHGFHAVQSALCARDHV